ncbi:MAG: hypothetical protein V2A62_01920 [Candidatus Woesearchaeota archaeon]
MLEIRTHHLFDFARTLVDSRFREREYFALIEEGGQSYTPHQSQQLRELFESLTDATHIKIVLGLDYLCNCCDASPEERERCTWTDSVWDCKELFGKITPEEVTTVKHLKEQYQLWKRSRYQEGWKKQIIAAHARYRQDNPMIL